MWTDFCDGLGIDRRITKAIGKLKFTQPLSAQCESIPQLVAGRDVLLRAPTGSGKTLAYSVPILNAIVSKPEKVVPLSCVIILPTKELCAQVYSVLSQLLHYAFDVVKVDVHTSSEYRRLDFPTILVCLPSSLAKLLSSEKGASASANIRFVVVDEADMVLSYGFEKDVRAISAKLPTSYQAVLTSATLTEDVDILKGLILHKPVVIDVKAAAADEEPVVDKKRSEKASLPTSGGNCRQFYINCASGDKNLILYGLIKGGAFVEGKKIIFVSSAERAYRMKILLDRFCLSSVVFNGEMPADCRQRVLDSFNEGFVPILIAPESEGTGAVTGSGGSGGGSGGEMFAAHRGIDFANVDVVINYDIPQTLKSYVHRVGRTARGGKAGVAVTFVDPALNDEASMLAQICNQREVKPMAINTKMFEPLRYRVEDVAKGVTRKSVELYKKRELMGEILHNDKLKEKLCQNSDEVRIIKETMRTMRESAKSKWHLKDIPDYLTSQIPTASSGLKLPRRNDNDDQHPSTKRQRYGLREKILYKEKKRNEANGLGDEADDDVNDNEGGDGGIGVDELAPISGRKLWKIRHKKKVGKPNSGAGKPPRVARKLWKSAKKFH